MPKNITQIPFFHLLVRVRRLKKNLLRELESLHVDFGDVFAIKLENLKCFIRRPDLIKHVLVENHLAFEKGVGFKLFQEVIGLGLLTSDGQKWVKERKVLNLEFTRHNQEHIQSVLAEELKILGEKWRLESKVNFTDEINKLTMRTICQILFNYKLTEKHEEIRTWFHDYDNYLGRQQKSFIKLPLWTPTPFYKRARKAVVGLRGFARELMEDCLKSNNPNMIKRMHEAGFLEETICDHVLTLFIAGHESTANSINFTLLLLRDNPDYILKLKKEVRSLNQGDESSLLDLVLKESLRLYPTIPLFPRIAKEDCKLGEFELKKGDMIAFSPWVMHRCEKYWNEPLKFYPERFEGKNYERDFTYLPFGGGPRKCIGANLSTQQMKSIFGFLFQNFDFEITGPSLKTFNHNVSLSPKGNIYLDLKSL